MVDPHTLKVEFEDDIRRFRLRLADEESPASQIQAVHKAISSGFSLGEDEPPLILKYKDDEGDLCTLVEATIEDFLSQPSSKPLRLVASRPAASPSTGTQAPSPGAVNLSATPAAASAQPALGRRAEASALCPQGHPLEAMTSSRGVHWQCNGRADAGGCKTMPVKGMKSYRCNACDYDLCQGCYEASPSKPAGSEMPTAAFSQAPDAAVPPWTRKVNSGDGCHSMGPTKLLMCLRTLHDADMMSPKMVGSMMLQFLPILSQRAHRKQEKLNKLGPQKREALLPILHSVSAHLDLVEEARSVKPLLEEFISGSDVTRLGDFVAALFKALSGAKDRHAVSEAITGVAPELLGSLPQLFPGLFGPDAMSLGRGPPEHCGIRCSVCNREPIKGPRFHCAEAGIDLCGECFIDQGCEVSDQQFQCFFTPPGEHPVWGDAHDWKESWKGEWRRHKKGEFFKGKGKGKHKGKWHQWWTGEPAMDATEEASSLGGDALDAGDFAPPGLEAPAHSWGGPWWHHHWRGKGKKGKGKDKGVDWSSMCPWGAWEGSLMPPALPPPFWPWGWETWQSEGNCGEFDSLGHNNIVAPTASEGRGQGDAGLATGEAQA